MKKIAILLVFVTLFTACGRALDMPPDDPEEKIEIPYTEDGEYAGFSDLPAEYTAEDAVRDGCYVVVSSSDVSDKENDLGLVAGGEVWEKFYEDSKNGKDAYIRVAHFIDGKPYYTDLYYADGEYVMFDLNDERGLVNYAPQKYLRELKDEINGREARMYVLTNETEITYRDVEQVFVSSSLFIEHKQFFWLGFTTYYVYDDNN